MAKTAKRRPGTAKRAPARGAAVAPRKRKAKAAAAKTSKTKTSRAKASKTKTSKTKASATKKAAAKKPRPSARRARLPQRFTVNHARDAHFDHGLRSYAAYRDLGIAAATGGLAQAHVIRFKPPFRPEEASTPHYHAVDFQMVYVLRGWYRTEFEGEGVHTFEAGSCWIQPPGIRHAVLGYSDDCELLEIVLPAEFETVTVDGI
ncbi:MAG: cupin domain-containing protein [Xanthobacteraceae bacterium]|nr:cupin domain-containing protein [Xanthobacteraceae bacterium]